MAAVATVLYFDLRVRKEGFDLQLLARGVGEDASAYATSPQAVGEASGLGGGGFAPPRSSAAASLRRRRPSRAAGSRRRSRPAAPLRHPRSRRPRPPAGGMQSGDPLADPPAARAPRGRRRGRELRPGARLPAVAAVVAAVLLARRRRAAAPPRARRMRREARAHAREILQERRFRGSEVPRPFHRHPALARRSAAAGRGTSSTTSRAGSPAGGPWCSSSSARSSCSRPLGLARGSIRRRASAAARAARARAPTREDPAALERDADRAAAAGEWETAVRLRFRAGLLRLDARELIEYRPSLTTGEVADAVGSPTFERVGADFDAIAYGGRPAGEQDEAASREGWQRVLSEAGTR